MSLYPHIGKKRKGGFGKFMLRNMHNMSLVGCLFLAVLATQATTQNHTQWGLPEGVKTRIGRQRTEIA